MAFVTVIAMLALIQYVYFGAMVGRARGRSGIKAPAVTGDVAFEQVFRAHQNTLEQLIVFIPALYAAGYFVNELYAVVAGFVFLVGRTLYFRAYSADPEKRSVGMLTTFVANAALVLAGLIGALLAAF